ncbi:MAG: hypothetical protein EXR99_00165 [Gemmataceae bacterium]|nr:hypothetical protein [Gemmataceae bacterium]
MNHSDLELLAAYFDRELPSWKRKKVFKLIQGSAEARARFRGFLKDHRGLRKLVIAEPTGALVKNTMARIHSPRFLQSKDYYSPTREVVLNPLFALSMAAGILVITCGISVYIFSSIKTLDQEASQAAAKNKTENALAQTKPSPAKEETPSAISQENTGKAKAEQVAKGSGKENPQNSLAKSPSNTVAGKGKSLNNNQEELPLTAPAMEVFSLVRVESTTPLVLKTLTANENEIKASLYSFTSKEKEIRLEIPAKDAGKAMAQLKAALAALKIQLLSDPVTSRRMRSPQWKTNYLLLVEDISTAELIALVLTAQTAPAGKDKEPSAAWDTVVVSKITANDRKQLKTMAGFSPEEIPMAPGEKTAPGFGEQKSKGSSELVGRKTALGLAYNPVRPALNSPEIKKFFEARKPIQKGNLQVLFLIRSDL